MRKEILDQFFPWSLTRPFQWCKNHYLTPKTLARRAVPAFYPKKSEHSSLPKKNHCYIQHSVILPSSSPSKLLSINIQGLSFTNFKDSLKQKTLYLQRCSHPLRSCDQLCGTKTEARIINEFGSMPVSTYSRTFTHRLPFYHLVSPTW